MIPANSLLDTKASSYDTRSGFLVARAGRRGMTLDSILYCGLDGSTDGDGDVIEWYEALKPQAYKTYSRQSEVCTSTS